MRSFRPRHTRTKTGCMTCRRRRKKCDGLKPQCKGCIRNKLPCDWPDLMQVSAKKSTNQILQSEVELGPDAFITIFKAACEQPSVRQNPTMALEISELLHHYAEVCVHSMADLTIDLLKPAWIEITLPDAQCHQFLMDAVYGLAAFHLAYLVPHNGIKYANMAHRYHGRSIQGFQLNVTRITSRNASAVLGFSFFQFVMTLASPFAIRSSSSVDLIDSLYSALAAAQGFMRLQPIISPYIKSGRFASWFRLDQEYPRTPSTATKVLPMLNNLRRINQESPFSVEERSICFQAIKLLKIFFSTVPFDPFEWQILFTWPSVLSGEFMRLIRSRQPIALIIVLHWLLPICHVSRHWLLSPWERPIINTVLRSIGSSWSFAVSDLLAEYSSHHRVDEFTESNIHLNVLETELVEEREPHLPELPVYLVHPDVKRILHSEVTQG